MLIHALSFLARFKCAWFSTRKNAKTYSIIHELPFGRNAEENSHFSSWKKTNENYFLELTEKSFMWKVLNWMDYSFPRFRIITSEIFSFWREELSSFLVHKLPPLSQLTMKFIFYFCFPKTFDCSIIWLCERGERGNQYVGKVGSAFWKFVL